MSDGTYVLWFLLFCSGLSITGVIAAIVSERRAHRAWLGRPDRSVLRTGSIEEFREMLRSGDALTRGNGNGTHERA
jgi:hypothetical protein